MSSRRPAGTGSIVERRGARGTTFSVVYRDSDGRQIRESLGRVSRREAEDALRDRLQAVRKGGWRKPPSQLTFGDYAAEWFATGLTRRQWKPTTQAQYVSVSRRLADQFGPLPLAEIRPRHIRAAVDGLLELGYQPSSIGRDLSVLHAILESAYRDELIPDNPARRAERPRVPRRRWKLLTVEQVRDVDRAFQELAAEHGDLYATCRVLFLALVGLGLRRHEALNLKWSDVDLVFNTLRVRKSKTQHGERVVAIAPRLAQRRRRRRRPRRPDEPGRAREHDHHPDLPAPRRDGLPRRGRPARGAPPRCDEVVTHWRHLREPGVTSDRSTTRVRA